MKKKLLILCLAAIMVFTLCPLTAMAAKPVTVTSAVSESGYGNVTELTFDVPEGDETNYVYFVTFSSDKIDELLPLFRQMMDPDITLDEAKMYAFQVFSVGGLVPKTPGEVVTADIQKVRYYLTMFQQQYDTTVVRKPLAVWITAINEMGRPDYAKAVEATNDVKYIPGVSNPRIPGTRLIAGDTPIAAYDEPNGEYTAEFTWYEDENTEPLKAGDTFRHGHNYTAEVNITVGDGYGKIAEGTEFSFGEKDDEYSLTKPNLVFYNMTVELTTDANQIMAAGYHRGAFDIAGKYDGMWKQTTFSNEGFSTYLYIGSDVENNNNYNSARYISAISTAEDGFTLDDLNTAIDFDFLNEGKVLQIKYTVKNIGESDVTYSLGSGADIQIGNDDGAVITEFTDGSGFEMVSSALDDKDADGNAAQFNFWCQNAKGVSDVDHFWYGAYDSDYKNKCTGDAYDNFISWYSNPAKAIFTPEKANRLSATDKNYTASYMDSAATWSWTNKTIAAGETQVYTLLFAIGGPGSEDLVSGDFTNVRYINDTITYSGDLEFNVTAVKVNGVVIDPGTYTVDKTAKTIRFDESAGLKARKTVEVVLGDTVFPVRNTIKAEGPKAILLYYGDGEDDYVELNDDNLFLNKEGNGPGSEDDYSLSYDSTAGEAKLNGCDIKKLELPSDGETTDGSVTLTLEDKSKIGTIESDYPLVLNLPEGANPETTLTTEEITAPELNVENGKLVAETITTNEKMTVNGGDVIAKEIATKGNVEVNQGGTVTANKIDADGNVEIGGEVTINASELGITCDELNIKDGGSLTINLPIDSSAEFMEISKLNIPEGYEIIGGTIDEEGNFTPADGATQLIIRKASVKELPFTDVKATAWSYDDIYYAWEKGLMVGTSATTFEPQLDASRAMIVMLLWRLEGMPIVDYAVSFDDVKANQWYTEAIRWAQANGIVKGYSKKAYGPNDPVTREQAAAIFYRYAEFKGCDVSAKADLSKFTDAGKIGDWAKENVAWANASGLMSGVSNSLFNPKGYTTRAQIAAILHRFCVAFEK